MRRSRKRPPPLPSKEWIYRPNRKHSRRSTPISHNGKCQVTMLPRASPKSLPQSQSFLTLKRISTSCDGPPNFRNGELKFLSNFLAPSALRSRHIRSMGSIGRLPPGRRGFLAYSTPTNRVWERPFRRLPSSYGSRPIWQMHALRKGAPYSSLRRPRCLRIGNRKSLDMLWTQ